jgi:5-methylcytosine-specific restriction endonuclease McrA
VLLRDQGRCQIKGKHCQTLANTVNHKIPKSQGGTDDPNNLEAACGWCNSSQGAPTLDPEPLGRW